MEGFRSAQNIDWFSFEDTNPPQYIEEWFDSVGLLTEDYLEAVYARVTFSLDLYPNPEYEDVWLGTYGDIALAREVYIMTRSLARAATPYGRTGNVKRME